MRQCFQPRVEQKIRRETVHCDLVAQRRWLEAAFQYPFDPSDGGLMVPLCSRAEEERKKIAGDVPVESPLVAAALAARRMDLRLTRQQWDPNACGT